jgi:DNA-binding MarR family transcriptional regulator
LTQKELSDELGLTQGTTVTAMDVMERRGLIERRRIDADRRKSFIYLTAKGRALRDELLPYAFEVNQAAEASISAAELKQLKDILTRINVSLSEDSASFAARQ